MFHSDSLNLRQSTLSLFDNWKFLIWSYSLTRKEAVWRTPTSRPRSAGTRWSKSSLTGPSASRPTRSTASGWSSTRSAGTPWAFAREGSTARVASSPSASASPPIRWETVSFEVLSFQSENYLNEITPLYCVSNILASSCICTSLP